jgi:hypothetical protein
MYMKKMGIMQNHVNFQPKHLKKVAITDYD